MEPNKPFPIYQLQDAFEAFCNSEPAAKPQHRSLYYFLLGYCRRRGNAPRFNLAYEAGMHGSGIGSWATYDTALKSLAEWGFILYTPGANRYKVPVVELTFRNPTDDVLLTYWQSYCLSTANSTDNPTDDVLLTQVVTLKEVLKKEKEKVGKLESEKTQLQADVAAASAALADSQKKIEGLQFEIDNYAAELYSDPIPPGPLAESPQPELRTPGGAADVGTRVGDGQNGQKGQKRAQKDKPQPGSANAADYQMPGWATTPFVKEFAAWLARRQTRSDCKPLTAPAVQARLNELGRYDEPFCLRLFEQAQQNPGWQGLTFDNTPHKFTQHCLDLQKLQANASRQNQQANGAKPNAAAAADVAEFLVRRRFQQPGGTAGDTGQTTGAYPGQGTGGAPSFGPH